MISMSVAECLSTDFAVIHPDMPVAEATRKLITKALLGGPVTDEQGQLVGWISEQECLQVTLQVAYHNTRVSTVNEVMKKDVVAVSLTDDLLDIAQRMLQAKPKTYPVVDDNNKVVGVITRRHLLHMLDTKLIEMGKR